MENVAMEVEMNRRNMNGIEEIDPFNVLGIEKGELPICQNCG